MLGALCYAEIGGVIPRSGAEIAYMKEGIGSVHQPTGEVLAYLYNWASTWILRPSSIAVLTLTASQYFLSGIINGKNIGFFLNLLNYKIFNESIDFRMRSTTRTH